MLLQVFHILFFYFVGECISHFIHGFIPGSVIGMVLLFLALAFKVVKPCHGNKISKFLTDNIGLFFLPLCSRISKNEKSKPVCIRWFILRYSI